MATLQTLRERLAQEHFDDGKLAAVRQLAGAGMQKFNCSDLGPLLEKSFPFGAARITALRALAPFIFDAATGSAAVLGAFKFESERKEAGDILAEAARLPPGWGRVGLSEALAARLAKEHFDEGRLAAVAQTLAMGGWTPMPCAAAAPLLGLFPFGDARLSALRALAPHLSDIPTGQAAITAAFKFDGERQQASAILAGVPAAPAPPPAYPPSGGGGGGMAMPGAPHRGGGMMMPGAAPPTYPPAGAFYPPAAYPPPPAGAWGAPPGDAMGAAMAGAMGAAVGAMGAMGAMASFAAGLGAAPAGGMGGFPPPGAGAYGAPMGGMMPAMGAPMGMPALGAPMGLPGMGAQTGGMPAMGAPMGGMPGMGAPMGGMPGMPPPGWGAPR